MIKIISKDPVLSKIRLLSCDVDGVLTDGGLYYDDEGKELRRFHVLDGLGIQMLQRAGIHVCIITQSTAKAIEYRAERLGIKFCYMGVENKLNCMKSLLSKLNLSLKDVAHVGDDLNDQQLLQSVGVPITVQNGIPTIMKQCRFVTTKTGGNGAVREIIDSILASIGDL
ncbi:HAD-IIIA family hydrolase [bacterium]|nr:HAD-IIIA family hydrolase [bacterium]